MRTRKLRFLSALLAVAMMFMLTPTAAFAEDGDTTTEYTIEVTAQDTGDATKSAVQKALERNNITDFDKIEKLTVKTDAGVELKKDDFQFMSGVQVTGDEGVNCKGKYAGTNTDLNITYLKNLTRLDLTNATCENNTFPPRAFCGNTKIETVIFPDNLVSSGFKTFANASALKYVGTLAGEASKTIQFPVSMTKIGESCFYHNPNLDCTLELPDTLTILGTNAFENSPVKMDKLTIRSDLTLELPAAGQQGTKHNATFMGTKIKAVRFEDGIEEIPGNFLASASDLQSIVIPDSVKKIGNYAFFYKNSSEGGTSPAKTVTFSKNLVIPASVETIGEAAFAGVGNVQNIIVANPDVTLSDYSFLRLDAKIYFAAEKENKGNNYQCWSADRSTILNTNGGTIATDGNGNVTAEEETYGNTTLYKPVKDGYEFGGWYTNVEDESTKLTSDPVAGTLYTAKWTVGTYTVKFDYNGKGGTNRETTVTYPATVAEPTPEKLEGYTFGGWYNGDTKFDFTKPVTENTTLTAKWYRNAAPINPASAYKVTVKGGTAWVKNGDTEEPIEFAEPDQTVIIKADDSSNDGMKFEQWKVNKGTVELKNDHAAETTFVMSAEPVELEAMLVTADTDDSSWDAATIVTGVAIGAGTAVLAYHIGTELYAEQILGKGVAIPRTRADVALTAWQLAGKPKVAIEGEPLSEAAMAQKWAVESGLMQNDADGSFNPDKKMSKLKALKVLDAAKKMG